MSSTNFSSTRSPRASVRHRCQECGRVIFPGEVYSRSAFVWEGDFSTNVACGHCAVLRRMVLDVDGDYSEVFYGGLGEWIGWSYPEASAGDYSSDLWLWMAVTGFGYRWTGLDGETLPLPVSWLEETA